MVQSSYVPFTQFPVVNVLRTLVTVNEPMLVYYLIKPILYSYFFSFSVPAFHMTFSYHSSLGSSLL